MSVYAWLSKISKGGSYNPFTLLLPTISGCFSGYLFTVCIRIPAQEHLEAKPMRTKAMPNYHDLDEICGKSTAIGQNARSAKDLNSEKLSDVNITQVQDSLDDTAVEDDLPLVGNEVEKTKKRK
ncbi:hypothetical protein GIB67_041483 [Kingdonia uniflora]|uniref:Uncharacterized protein n=1 Tax=Kingdonia uniflora TaxID=39325 RepID=A0A7J7LRX3_9MAGN|nr:hypothetical protein GIB67_041483 [Kingdonia uniflora]